MSKPVKSGIALIIGLGLGTPLTASGAAPARDEARSISVSFADLDIENRASARVLYARLQQASRKACSLSPYVQYLSLVHLSTAKACYEGTLKKPLTG